MPKLANVFRNWIKYLGSSTHHPASDRKQATGRACCGQSRALGDVDFVSRRGCPGAGCSVPGDHPAKAPPCCLPTQRSTSRRNGKSAGCCRSMHACSTSPTGITNLRRATSRWAIRLGWVCGGRWPASCRGWNHSREPAQDADAPAPRECPCLGISPSCTAARKASLLRPRVKWIIQPGPKRCRIP